MLRIKDSVGVWQNIPTPSDYQIGIMDISDAKRNANGDMVKELITTKTKLTLMWRHMKRGDLQKFLVLVGQNLFELEYIDPKTDELTEGTFYSGDRQMGALKYVNGKIVYIDIIANFIEA